MHFHREAAAVTTHVGDFDDVGFAPAQRFPDRIEVVAGQVRVEQLDRLADDDSLRMLTGSGTASNSAA